VRDHVIQLLCVRYSTDRVFLGMFSLKTIMSMDLLSEEGIMALALKLFYV